MVNNWKLWCRLCAYEGSTNIDINLFRSETNFPDELKNLFSINISEASNLSSMICLNCHERVKGIIAFGNKVSRVQSMFLEILNSNKKDELDLKQLKVQYKLDDDEFDRKLIDINAIDKIDDKQTNILQDPPNEMVDLFEPSNIKVETTLEDFSDGFDNEEDCCNQPIGLDKDESINNNGKLKSDSETKELTETPNKIRRTRARETQQNTTIPIKCSECKKTFANLNSMKRHLRKQHGLSTRVPRIKSPFICEECGKICKSLPKLDEHKLVHVEDRPFKCKQCEKCFKNKLRLKYHEDTHSTTSYICTICGIRLNSKPTLNMHMVIHSDEKRFKCDYCGNEYKRAKALKTHLILHTGLKPYTCDFCDRTFANGSNCRSHKKKSHPVELAAMEAAGKASSYTKVPELKDLRASLPLIGDMHNDNS
ncbi:zinc finger protein weckle-like [Episyrphus balteatus]|uniref:zinc finger protein weckle-like n=1 Tax=Episyrphus balteatus TaxID=286459 RepID=UPI0024850F36|nr:zinc finger protein weckle-like [Episyrphus balteatus]